MILGISDGFHDSSVSLIDHGNIVFAAHSERYSKIKNDPNINKGIIEEALAFGTPEKICYYEKPFLKFTRCLFGGNYNRHSTEKYFNQKIIKVSHHKSHASAGYFTSSFDEATIIVLDAIGEWNTSTIWSARGNKIKPVYVKNYPFSFGLFYSAFTQLIGLKPNEEEYILMGMAAYGNKKRYMRKVNKYFPSIHKQKYNFHSGINDWGEHLSEQDKFDIAASVQHVYESRFSEFLSFSKEITKSNNLVLMGGCALNCSANNIAFKFYDNVWIMPNPGDAGSSLGAAAAVYGKHLNWNGPYLGTNIGGEYPTTKLFEELKRVGIVGVANGRAEFGPRALGNRSLLADPRGNKDIINSIKRREEFRPFAPIVLEEDAYDWFDMDRPSPYMQYTFRCKRPSDIPAVVHEDGTSRVQTVNKDQHQGLYELLKMWKEYTGVPVLLNTSLNVRGMPMINDLTDIEIWKSVNPDVNIYT